MDLRKLAIFNAASIVFHILIAFLSQLKVTGAADIGEISDKYPTLFTPASFTFSIWSVIYVALIGFVVYHIIKAKRSPESDPANVDLRRTGKSFIVNNIAAGCWMIVWINEWFLISVLLIIVQLIALIRIHQRIGIHDAGREWQSKVFTQFPLSIYLGWISIATVANISTSLVANGWSGWGMSEINWTITMIAVAMLITIGVINRKKNVFFGLVVLWALYGIMSGRKADDHQEYEPVIMFIYIAMAIVALACLFGFIRNLRRS